MSPPKKSSKRMLALETTTLLGSVAIFEEDRVVEEMTLPIGQRSAQSFATGIRRLLENVAWKPTDLDIVALTVGPGSFTGLRVGVTAAKILAYALSAEVIGLNTLEVIAHQGASEAGDVTAIIDAFRGQLFVQNFTRESDHQLSPIGRPEIVESDSWLASLEPGQLVTGPVLEKLVDQIPKGVVIAPRECWNPSASTVGRLAWRRYQSGERDDPWSLAPKYYRKSAAEEKIKGR